jgi:hypothetical protein
MEKVKVLGLDVDASTLERETAMMGSTVIRREYPFFRQSCRALEHRHQATMHPANHEKSRHMGGPWWRLDKAALWRPCSSQCRYQAVATSWSLSTTLPVSCV